MKHVREKIRVHFSVSFHHIISMHERNVWKSELGQYCMRFEVNSIYTI